MIGFSEERFFREAIEKILINHPFYLKKVYEGEDRRYLIYRIRDNDKI